MKNLPLGIRSNNPGNLRNTNINWQGKVADNKTGYEIFKDEVSGLRALAKDLINKNKNGFNTITRVINRYAPESDNNNTKGYIQRVSDYLGIGANDVLNLTDPLLKDFMTAIIMVENGNQYENYYSDELLDKAIAMARGRS